RIGAVRVSSVAGVVWQDLNNDGLYGASEPTLSGVRVELRASGALVADQTTGEDGRYAFEMLRPGNYTVMLTLPDGWVYGRRVPGAEGSVSHVEESDRAQARYTALLMARTASKLSHAVAALPLGSLSGQTVLTDSTPLSGVAVRLMLGDRTLAETVTDGRGAFRFEGLRPGAYRVRYALTPNTHAFEDPAAGASAEADAALTAGQNRLLQPPKIVALGTAEGRIFGDLNDNGKLDAGEEGVSGVKVELWQDGARVAYAETARSGAFRFESLRPGAYQLTYTLPGRYVAARNTALKTRFNLGMGEARAFDPAGCYAPASISGTVWLDEDANGRMGSREAALQGVNVSLLRQEEHLDRTVTGADGRYAFENLAPGDYAVEVQLPEALMFASGGMISNVDGSLGQSGRIRLEMGMNRDGQSVGAVSPGELYGLCWADSVYNGLWDEGESFLTGAMISLLDETNAVVRQTQTGADGSFSLDRVRPGKYRMHVVLPEGMVFSLQAQGGSSMPVSDARQGFGPYFALGPAQLLEDRNVAAIRPGSIRGEAFVDANNDGKRGLEESGLSGTVIRLTDARGALVKEHTCPADGTFVFEGLRPGTYTLSAQWPEGYVPSAGAERTVTLAMGGESPRQFFGALLTGSIEGRVFEDLDADGYWGLQDPCMAGVMVALLMEDGSA
ncbi:MAG TPA: SdrD B-like domain-containing protein, partial [Clostridia bacterium]|nr:SdrD B-like domain-containing protein [Clostridia bacterium]